MLTSARADSPGTTIPIADAIDLLASRLGSLAEAREVLVDRAQIGDLQTIAARAHGPFDGSFLDDRDWSVPSELWLRLGDHSPHEWRRGDLTGSPDTDLYAELQDGYGTPLRVLGVHVELESLNRLLAALPIEWLDADDVIELLSSMFGSALAAGMAVVKRAHSGLVRTRASFFKWEERVDYHSRRDRKVEKEAHFATLPKEFWWAEGHEALTQNWICGDFSTWIDEKFHWQAFGTQFARCDIEAMLPRRNPTQAGASERDEGANPEHRQGAHAATIPADDDIENKMRELIELGMKRDVAAKVIRQISGFEAVGNEHARRAVNGRLPLGRPRKEA